MSEYQNLELDYVLKKVSENATFSKAQEMIQNEKVSFNPLHIRRNLKLTSEAMDYLKSDLRPDFSAIKDISSLFDLLKKGYILNPAELLLIYDHNIQIKRVIKNLKEKLNDLEIYDYVISLYYSEKLIDLLSANIDQSGTVKEDATSKLKELNRQRRHIEAEISDRASQFLKSHASSLQEAVVYQRDGRTTFLVKNSDKNKYEGYSHGLSASGQAAYIEPKVFVELNNRLNEVKAAIEEEITQILRMLSSSVSKDVDYFKSNLDSITYLDAIFAKAVYGIDNKGVIAKISDHDLILENIAHPLIDAQKVVTNSYHIKGETIGVVITGSNTGGKTVSLKVIALSVLMSYLGIPLIADEAMIPLYDGVYDDIDDGQSLVDSLSTFSSRLVALDNILEKMTNSSLVLIDEIASGTDPKEGEALAIAIIDRLVSAKVTFVITTHFNRVKEYALKDSSILIASQEFDTEKMVPTYRYIEDSFGSSNALEIASRYIKDQALIKNARSFLKINETDEERALKAIEKKARELEIREMALEANYKKQIEINSELQRRLDEFTKQKDELYKKAKIKADHYLERQKEKIRRELHKALLKSVQEKRNDIDEKAINLSYDTIKEVHPIDVGDHVKVLSTSQVGKVLTIKKDQVTIDVNGIAIKTALDNLEYVSAPAKVKAIHREKSFKRAKSEIVLVGMHVDEAIESLHRFLDEAYGSGLKQVKVIHGAGTGALRSAISKELQKTSFIKGFRLGDSQEGGSNVTIVEL